MSLPKLRSHFKCSLACALLLAVAAMLLLCFDANAAMLSVAPGDAHGSLTGPQSLPVVQVTTDQAEDVSPALVQAADGKLLTVFARNGALWSRSSTDGGATWAAETQITGCCRYNHSLARAADGSLWLAYGLTTVIVIDPPGYVVEKREIWYRTSADGGVTWSAERQLATDSSSEHDPIVFQATDHKLWIVWQSDRSGNPEIWYKISADDGATWSADSRLTTNGFAPTITQAANGRLVVVWNRGSGELWQRNSNNGGVTWSIERQIAGCCRYGPSLAAVDGVLWLAYEQDEDIWYRTSTDQGGTWSDATRFTRFVASDGGVTLAALASGKPGLVWHSIRSGNRDIWFGVPGEREDCCPPPYIEWIEHRPRCNPDSDDTITFLASARDETGVAGVSLVWTSDGDAREDQMFDDGTHGDEEAGDGVWTVQHDPLPEGSQVTYTARASDTDGNTYLYPGQNSFTVLTAFFKTADILFVLDAGGYAPSSLRSYYSNTLEALGYRYDTWDTNLRCALDSTILNQYVGGIVIWAVPSSGYITDDSNQRTAVQGYLDEGGKLFITGQNIARYLSWYGGAGFLADYLHATFRQDDTGRYALAGAAGDPIGDGLALNISGGDGANNQYSTDEVNPIAPAQIAFTYQAGASAMLAEPIRPVEAAPGGPQDTDRWPQPDVPGALPQRDAPARPAATPTAAPTAAPEPTKAPEPTAAPPEGCSDSCAAGLRVDTGTYKVVYFAFGFEAINSGAYRVGVMERVLAWLAGKPPRPVQMTPAYGQAVPAGAVSFTWLGVPGATSYEIRIDTVPTFDSPDPIDKIVNGTSYSHTFATLGTRYWRVRALPGGDWTFPWPFSITAGVTQVTTDPADDASPALAQMADGKLLTVFVRNGNLWSRASTDDGATWAAETQITGCCRYRPSLARAADGTLWLTYDRDSDIWYRTSADHGVTWTAERQLTTDGTGDYDPVVFQAADGKLWVVWQSSPSYYYPSIWYKTSANGGATWSSNIQLTRDAYDYAPAATVASDGRLVVVWNRFDQLWQRSSSDGGATWSAETQIAGWNRYRPGLAAVGGDLWLVYEQGGDIWYRTSADQGGTWSAEVRFTRFVGGDNTPAAAALASVSIGIAWQSDRSSNPDIWFGSPGERTDLNPPPYVSSIAHQPWPNPDSDDTITFRASAQDETRMASVTLVWTLDGVAQADLPMFDNGTHGDEQAGDGVWSVQHPPLLEGSQVTYRARATDSDNNNYRYPGQNSFKVLPRFVKTAAILFVPDAGGNNTPTNTAWFRPYYTDALEALDYRYDVWDTGLRGAPGSEILTQYTSGAVIWAVPYWGYVTDYGADGIRQLQAYLDAGGKLFITGQNIANYLSLGSGAGFLKDYLHATFRQEDTGLYALAGAAGDPIGDGLTLNISGGDGANNQYSKDEVDPIAPAEVMFTYRAGTSAMLAEPVRPAEEAPSELQAAGRRPSAGVPPQDALATPAASVAAAPAGNVGSGTAGLRVGTDTYKVVYFDFGFEAINSAADRQAVMERVLDWLDVSPLTRLYLPLVFAQLPTAGSFWADRYRLEPGECTTLHWSVTNARAVYLDDMGVAGQSTQQVCPADTHTYVLRVERESGVEEYRVTIIVSAGDVTLWHGWTGAEADALAEVITAFQDANPGVTVDTLAVPFNQLKNKFATEASTGGGPDLLIGPKDWIGELAQAGLIAPLDDLASKIGLDQLNKSAVDANTFAGKVWAFPESTEAVALWYNKDKVKETPKSEAGLLKQAAEVGLAYNSGFYHSAGILLAEGGRVFDDQRKCAFGQGDSVVNGLAFIKDAKGTPNVIMDGDYGKLDAAFKDGKVGLIFDGPWATGYYVKALGADKLGIADPIAVGIGKFAPFLGTKNIFLSANSKNGCALDFLKFMSKPTTQAMLTKVGHIPSNPNVKVDDPFIAAFLKQTASVSYFPNEPEMGAVWAPAADMITKVIEGTLAPADAVKEACAAIDEANGK